MAASALLTLSVLALGCGESSTLADAGGAMDATVMARDTGPIVGSLGISVDYGGEACGEHSTPHAAPDYLLRIQVTAPPDTPIEIWAARPSCGVAPFLFREVTTDGVGAAEVTLENDGMAACTDPLLGGWEVWASDPTGRSEAAPVVVASAACGLDCAEAATHCAPPPDGGTAAVDAGAGDAGSTDAGSADSGAPDGGPGDAGPPPPGVLATEPGCFYTASASEPRRLMRMGEVGVVYQRVEIRFDVIAGPYRPHEPDPSNRTEHILFGFFRANQPRSFQRYLGGAAAVTFESRGPHFRMFGRDEIAMGFMSYASDSGTYRWTEGDRYTIECAFDATVPEQTCTLSTGGAVVASRRLPVPYLDAATHLSTAFDLHLGAEMDNEIEVSPHGWQYCDLRVRATR